MLAGIGPTEILVIAIVVLILFGGKKLPEMGRGLGEAFKEFKNAFGSKKKESKK
jgi:sec-independent protein translocase protein TatA